MTNKALCALFYLTTTSFLVGCGDSSEGTDDSGSSTDITDSSDTINSPLKINEIVASDDNGGNDWIELYATEDGIDLSNYTIVDDNEDREPQALPSVTLNNGEFIVIQAIDEEDIPADDTYYVTFKLGSDDAVSLIYNNTIVDTLDWEDGDALAGFSYGLFADGSDNAQTLFPTAGATNTELDDDSASTIAPSDTLVNENAALRINEIVTAEVNDGFDWIEFYVTGDADVNLSDYTIADESGFIESLPDVTLAPGEYYQIYATDDETTDVEHIIFKLGASDELSLYLGDDLVDYLSWNKGQALVNYSYGRYPDGSDGTQVLSPSPEITNATAIHTSLVINEVKASDLADGHDWFELYNNSDQDINLADYQIIDSSDDIDPVTLPDVTLAANESIVIYAVDEEISEYYVPFKLGKTDELNLILNAQTVDYIEWDDSDVIAGFSYGLTDITSSTNSWDKDFLTPTNGTANQVASAFNPDEVRNLYFDISTDNWQSILSTPLAEEYHETSITFDGVTLESVAIRTKGGSSLNSVANSTSDRYSFKIDINEYVDGQKFFGLKKFTLQNSFNDPTYMRETIAYNLLQEMGVAAPQHSYVNVYINGELFGLYLMVEVIDGEFIENHFANSNGDLYKPDGVGSDLNWISSSISSYYEINQQTNEDSSDQGAFINFVDQLDSGSTDVIDIDSVLRYMAVSVSLSNLDSYHGPLAHNYYIYEQDGVFSMLPWDLNETFGTFAMGCTSDTRELYIDEPTDGALSEKPLVANVFANQTYLDTYHDYLWQLIEGPLADDTFDAEVNRIADLIREHVQNDPTAFYTSAQFELNLHSTVSRFYGLTSFMEYRVDNMVQQLEGAIPSSNNGNGFCTSTR